jgi:hypothetical protein
MGCLGAHVCLTTALCVSCSCRGYVQEDRELSTVLLVHLRNAKTSQKNFKGCRNSRKDKTTVTERKALWSRAMGHC